MTSLATIGSIVGIGAGLTGIATGVNSLVGGGSGGGGGGPTYPISLNPAQSTLKDIFGKSPITQQGKNQLARSAFGNDFGSTVSNYINNPTSFGPGGPGILSSIIGDPSQYLQNYQQSLGYLDQAVGNASQAAQTGFKTNGDAYFNEAIRQYMQKALPAAAETSGLGVQSSGFQAASSQAASDLLGQASLANIDLNEAAANRRLQATPLLQGLTAARQQLPLNLASDLTGLFNFEARKPIDVFSQLYSLNNGQYAAPSYSPTNTGSANTAAILQGLGQLGSGLGSAVGALGGGSGQSQLGASLSPGGYYGYNQNTGYNNIVNGTQPIYQPSLP